MLLRLQPQCGDARGHGGARYLGGGHGGRSMVVHGVRIGGRRVRAGLRRDARTAGAHGRGKAAGAHCAGQHAAGVHADGDRGRGCVEAVDRVLVMIRGHHRAKWIDRPRERFGAAQRRRHLGRPVVVRRVGRVQRVRVAKRLHELRAKAVLEVGRGHGGRVHRVAFALAPLGPTVFEPNLEFTTTKKRSEIANK